MLVDDEPSAPHLLINVGHSQCEVDFLAMLIGAGHALNTVTIGKIAIGADVEISQVNRNRAVKAAEKGLPVFAVGCGTDILTRRDDIETTSVWSGTYTFMIASTSFALNAATKRSTRPRISARVSAQAGEPNVVIESTNSIARAVTPAFSCFTICLPLQGAPLEEDNIMRSMKREPEKMHLQAGSAALPLQDRRRGDQDDQRQRI